MQGIVRGQAPGRLGASLAAALVALMLAGPGSAHGAAEHYPGAAPCNGSLQRCIDGSPRGTKIKIDRNVHENLEIRKSISLLAAAGSEPVIGSGSVERAVEIRARTSRELKTTLRGITFRNVEIDVELEGGSGHRVVIKDSSIDNPLGESNGTSGIDVFGVRPGRISIRNNDLATKGSPIDVDAVPEAGPLKVEIINNLITTSDNPAGVDTNLSASGIEVDVGGTASAEVDVYSNLVYGVAGCNCGGAAGIEIGGSAAEGTVNLIGNTVDDAQFASSGLEVDDNDPGSLTVNAFDNIVSNASQDVIELPNADPGLAINHDFNDAYDPGDPADYNGYPAGSHSDEEDPLYIDAASGDYRLQAASPQKQQGIICPPGGQSATDLAGNDRVERVVGVGAFVTPGAYGFAPGPPAGLLLLGTDQGEDLEGGAEDDVICAYGGDDTAAGKGGDDAIAGGNGADKITDGNGDDYLYGEAGMDTITAGAGSDYLSGGDDFDELEAHDGIDGNDYLDGGGGVDSCNPDPGDAFTNC